MSIHNMLITLHESQDLGKEKDTIWCVYIYLNKLCILINECGALFFSFFFCHVCYTAKLCLRWWPLQYSCLITELLHDVFNQGYICIAFGNCAGVWAWLHRAKSTFIQLTREAEVALEPNLMFLSFSASRRKTRIWLKPVEELWSQVQDWAFW